MQDRPWGVLLLSILVAVVCSQGLVRPLFRMSWSNVVLSLPPISPLSEDERNVLGRLSSFRIKADPGARVFSVGDVHGDNIGLRMVLANAGLIDKDTQSNWTGGNSILVQTGDLVDRGDGSADAMRLLWRLQVQAPKFGGRVICLLGNHELMNIVHDFRFVTEEENNGFGGSLEARAAAFGAQGEFGYWLRSLPLAVVVELNQSATLFVHGGLDSYFLKPSSDPLATLDSEFARLLDRVDQRHEVAYEEPMLGEHGPLWNRFFAMKKNETFVCETLNVTLNLVNAQKMVVGHTVVEDGPAFRCNGRLVLGDVGFSPYYNPPHGKRLLLEHWEGPNGAKTRVVQLSPLL